ncbi:MAG: hypothetical protein JNJ56_14860, partial [Ignavibacteria bacterium]|nr:hypothetical protein [Ignavibacteria bacterium]
MKYIYNKIFYFLVLFLFFSQSERQNANAYNINFGPATYTNGSYTETLSIPCNGTVYLRSGGSITFQVSAFGDILEYITLSASPLPPGATFPTVSGGHAVQSTFSWTQESSFTGTVNFLLMPYEIVCSVIFDWPLPVELSSFNSVVYGNDVTLNWTTASEINNSGFDIERKLRTDEISGWIVSGSLPGNGNSNVQNNYTFTDLNLNSGTYQYRLKQTDFNGSYEYF